MNIPVIDIGPFLAGEKGALDATAKAIAAASETLGFYFLRNHGIPQTLIDRVFAQTQRFHELPLEKKLEVQAIGKVIGYLPLGGQTQNTSIYGKSTYPDASASFYIKREFAPDHPDRIAKRPWVQDNRWPSGLPGFRETCLEYFDAMTALGHKMLCARKQRRSISRRTHSRFTKLSIRAAARCGCSIIRRAIPQRMANSASGPTPITAIAPILPKRRSRGSKF